jgi:outer membrane lipoprotein
MKGSLMPSNRLLRLCLAPLFGALLAACSSNVPKGLGEKLPDAPSQRAVQAKPDRYEAHQVRWGGEILGVRNGASSTEVEIFGRPLSRSGEPLAGGGDGVRFIARVKGFLDPAEFQVNKRLAVRGRVAGTLTRPVGEFPYIYPVVDVDVYHLWPVYQPPPPAWAHDPWGVWGPWGPWGHHRHFPHRW